MTFGQNMQIQSSKGVQSSVTAPAISTPTISMADQTVLDNGGAISTDLPAVTVTGVEAGAVYSLVADPTAGKLTINSTTGVMTWNGDVNGNQVYSITVKITNPDGGNASVTFTLNVTNNL
jgi:hypothetical protein